MKALSEKRKDTCRKAAKATYKSRVQAKRKEEVYDWIIKNEYWLEEILMKYFTSVDERNEFRQELWLILLQMKEEKLLKYFNNTTRDELKGIVIGIVNNQVKSVTSPWHNKYRKHNYNLLPLIEDFCDAIDESPTDIGTKNIFEEKIDYIDKKLKELEKKNVKMYRDATIFRMYYFEGLSYLKISKRTNVAYSLCHKYLNNVKAILQRDRPDLTF